MRIKQLNIKNIGILKDQQLIEVNKPLVLFYGDIQQGKTTILNSIRFLAGGKAVNIPSNLIREGQSEAFIEMILENGRVYREFYRGQDGSVKARKLEASINNLPLNQDQVTALFNPFLLDQNHFTRMNAPEKTRFLLDIFGVNTSDLDNDLKEKEQSAKELRIKIKAYGEIDITPIEKIDTEALLSKKAELQKAYDLKYQENKKVNENLRDEYRTRCDKQTELKKDWEDSRSVEFNNKNLAGEALSTLIRLGYKGSDVEEFISNMPLRENFTSEEIKEPQYIDELPSREDLDSIEREIREAGVKNEAYKSYIERVEKNDKKQKDIEFLSGIEAEIRSIRKEKGERLQFISDKIEGLVFDEDGKFRYMNTDSDMLSDSQQMDLSSRLSALYPEGLKIELIDRGESLGKSIFKLVDRAKEQDRNILVTIVGDRPAETPEEIGVFEVEAGQIK